MKTPNDGGAAFPCELREWMEQRQGGVSLRAYIATAVLNGMASDPKVFTIDDAPSMARDACIIADALIAELERHNVAE